MPFYSNLLCIQYLHLLNFCRLWTFWKINVTKPTCLSPKLETVFSFLFWKTRQCYGFVQNSAQDSNTFQIIDKKEQTPFLSPTQHTHTTLINCIAINIMLECNIPSPDLFSHRTVSGHVTPTQIHNLGPRHCSMSSDWAALLWPNSDAGRRTTHWWDRLALQTGDLWWAVRGKEAAWLGSVESFGWNIVVPPIGPGNAIFVSYQLLRGLFVGGINLCP